MAHVETELQRAVRLQFEKYCKEMIYADRIKTLIDAMPPSDGQKKDTIRFNRLALENKP